MGGSVDREREEATPALAPAVTPPDNPEVKRLRLMSTLDPTPEPLPEPDAGRHQVEVVPWYRSPAFIIAAFAVVILLVIVFIVVAVTHTDETPNKPPTPTVSVSPSPTASPTPSASPTPQNLISRATVLKTQFVEPFRVRFRALGEDRSDASIADVGVSTCNMLLNHGLTHSSAMKAIQLQLGTSPAASQDDAREVAKLAVMNTCPDRQKAFVGLWGN